MTNGCFNPYEPYIITEAEWSAMEALASELGLDILPTAPIGHRSRIHKGLAE